MIPETTTVNRSTDVPQSLIQALFRHPQALQSVLDDAGLPPHRVAMWARQVGAAHEIEKLAGWLSVGQQLGCYKPLLEVAASHLRAGDLLEALPVFRWAYRAWRSTHGGRRDTDGVKLLALWGQCLHRLNLPGEAEKRWLHALNLVGNEDTLNRLARIVERAGATEAYQALLDEALRRDLPGAVTLQQRWQRIANTSPEADGIALETEGQPTPRPRGATDLSGVAVMADVANLDQVCGDQYGFGRQLDYGHLLQTTSRHGPVRAKLAFVPDVPDTLPIRQHLEQAGFQIDLKRPKRSHGRIVANADTAMAACAVRWASDPGIGRLELWTGDGDFLKVQEVIGQTWRDVAVVFRSFEVGTAAVIRRLGDGWEPIGPQHLRRSEPHFVTGDEG